MMTSGRCACTTFSSTGRMDASLGAAAVTDVTATGHKWRVGAVSMCLCVRAAGHAGATPRRQPQKNALPPISAPLSTPHPLIFFSTMRMSAFSYSAFIVFWSAWVSSETGGEQAATGQGQRCSNGDKAARQGQQEELSALA